MTAIWGPLGWMTLHSVSTIYPEKPTQAERDLMSTWLDMFRDTITCPSCKGHFTQMLQNYRTMFPNMMASRQDFAMFGFRAHNAVNRRLNKPVQGTLGECMDRLRTNVKTRSAREYRNAYINHISRFWATMRDVSGIVASKKIREMKKIEAEYFTLRDTNFVVELNPDPVVLPRDVMERQPGEVQPERRMALPRDIQTGGFRITAKGIRLR